MRRFVSSEKRSRALGRRHTVVLHSGGFGRSVLRSEELPEDDLWRTNRVRFEGAALQSAPAMISRGGEPSRTPLFRGCPLELQNACISNHPSMMSALSRDHLRRHLLERGFPRGGASLLHEFGSGVSASVASLRRPLVERGTGPAAPLGDDDLVGVPHSAERGCELMPSMLQTTIKHEEAILREDRPTRGWAPRHELPRDAVGAPTGRVG